MAFSLDFIIEKSIYHDPEIDYYEEEEEEEEEEEVC